MAFLSFTKTLLYSEIFPAFFVKELKPIVHFQLTGSVGSRTQQFMIWNLRRSKLAA